MKHYPDFCRTGQTFADCIGEPEEFEAAIGRIALAFSFLEETAGNVIVLLSGLEHSVGSILTAELSFRQKVDVIGSLVRRYLSEPRELPFEDADEQALELAAFCRRAEQLRNTYLHSSYVLQDVRTKVSAKAKKGLHVAVEPVDPDFLLDVADYILGAAVELESLPMLLGIADLISGNGRTIEYQRDGEVIAVFRHGGVEAT